MDHENPFDNTPLSEITAWNSETERSFWTHSLDQRYIPDFETEEMMCELYQDGPFDRDDGVDKIVCLNPTTMDLIFQITEQDILGRTRIQIGDEYNEIGESAYFTEESIEDLIELSLTVEDVLSNNF
ncbi:hypothetical protein GF362_04670 [Candidatus Dojkabacteria bacterium]|nr:hypothetical protein [Candidatus Dojkabacteria bacterium]